MRTMIVALTSILWGQVLHTAGVDTDSNDPWSGPEYLSNYCHLMSYEVHVLVHFEYDFVFEQELTRSI